MATVIDSAPSSVTVPRDDCVDVVITAHNDDAQPAVLGTLDVVVGDQDVRVSVTLPGSDSTPVEFGEPVLSADLVAAGATVEVVSDGVFKVCGPDYDPASHTH